MIVTSGGYQILTHKPSEIPVVIAAGGNGYRIGGNKPDLILGGTSLIDRIMSRATIWSQMIAVALRDKPQFALPAGTEFLFDTEEDGGPLSALSSALAFAQSKKANHVLLIPCDMPFLPADLLQRLVQEIGSSQVAVARSDGQIHPISALWSVDALPKLAEYATGGRRSLIGFAETMEMKLVDWNGEYPDPFFNINTPKDYKKAEKFLLQYSEV